MFSLFPNSKGDFYTSLLNKPNKLKQINNNENNKQYNNNSHNYNTNYNKQESQQQEHLDQTNSRIQQQQSNKGNKPNKQFIS